MNSASENTYHMPRILWGKRETGLTYLKPQREFLHIHAITNVFASLQALGAPVCLVLGEGSFHTECLLWSFSALFETESLTEMPSGALSGRDWLAFSWWPPLPCKNNVLGTCYYCASPRIFLCKCWGPKLRPSCLHTKCFSNTILLSKMFIIIFWKHFSAKCALFEGWVLCLSCLPVIVFLLFGSHF